MEFIIPWNITVPKGTNLLSAYGIQVTDYIFRNKMFGWGLDGTITGNKNNHSSITQKINPDSSSYYRFFLDGEIYRDCCYSCPYAQEKRIGDLTIGDYWGIETYNPELIDTNGGTFSVSDGVSCLLVNTEKGKRFLESCDGLIRKSEIPLENIKIVNTQLKHPAVHSNLRDKVLTSYVKDGYVSVNRIFILQKMQNKIRRKIKGLAKKVLPEIIVQLIKNNW